MTAHAVALDLSQDPATPNDAVSQELEVEVDGPNKQYIKPGAQTLNAAATAQTLDVKFVWPDDSAKLADEDPHVKARLEIGKKKLQTTARLDLDGCRLAVLSKDLEAVAQRLAGEGYYVRNPLLGGTTGPLADKAYQIYGVVWDWTAGWLWSKNKGMRCEDWLNLSKSDVIRVVQRVDGDRARLESISIDEKSTVMPQGIVDQLDRLYTINHILFKLTAPNGNQYSIDFWEHFRDGAGNPPVLQEWETTRQVWLRRLAGDVDPASFMHHEETFIAGGPVVHH